MTRLAVVLACLTLFVSPSRADYWDMTLQFGMTVQVRSDGVVFVEGRATSYKVKEPRFRQWIARMQSSKKYPFEPDSDVLLDGCVVAHVAPNYAWADFIAYRHGSKVVLLRLTTAKAAATHNEYDLPRGTYEDVAKAFVEWAEHTGSCTVFVS